MFLRGFRRVAGAYLALFFLAVAAAPHLHLNGLEDLFLDGRSDSGTVIKTVGPAGTARAPTMSPVWHLEDLPCLACFTNDFVGVPTASFFLVASSIPFQHRPPVVTRAAVPLVPTETCSRAPPNET